MNILLIGNGFDLAHGLPTKYKDFLDFIKLFKDYYMKEKKGTIESFLYFNEKVKNGSIDWIPYKKSDKIIMFFEKWFNTDNENRSNKKEFTIKIIDEFFNCVKYNIWIEYFFQCDMYQKENWIDFESEISNVIQQIEQEMNIVPLSGTKAVLNDVIKSLPNEKLNEIYFKNSIPVGKEKETTYKKVREQLYKDLNRLTRALEIYLDESLRDHQINVISPDINEIKIDAVLSFNYTDTYRRLYDKENIIQYDFIHGKADSNRIIEYNNMVLGIDEYLPEDRRNKDVEFIAFKKFYQRIYKETGCKYKEWVDKIRMSFIASKQNKQDSLDMMKKLYNSPENQQNMMLWYLMYQKNNNVEWNNLYIFGHSLDVTDGDVLRDLILNDNVYTTIYYLNKDVMGQQIVNLVKVIGQDELIKRTGGSTKTIEFKQQQDMIITL